MRQILHSLQTGETIVANVPCPGAEAGQVLIRTTRSLISSGTERMLVNFGRAGWLDKIRQQPDRWRAVIDKIRSDGPIATWKAIQAKLVVPLPLGYCNVGKILEGSGTEFLPAQRVVSNGYHAEIISLPPQLVAVVPDGVSDEAATFTPLAAIAYEGMDLLQVKPGDYVMVLGLGLVGQLAVRLLKGMGVHVLGADPDPARRALAEKYGVRVVSEGANTVDEAMAWSRGNGVAGVLITASSPSHLIVSEAARSCRYRGRVVLVGVVGLRLNRADFYRNEVSFQVSCSYGKRDHFGPGSAQANFRQVLSFMETGKLPVEDLITHRFRLDEASHAYFKLQDKSSLGILLEYEYSENSGTRAGLLAREIRLREASKSSRPRVCFLGAGNFASRILLPALAKCGVRPKVVISRQGASALFVGQKFGAAKVGTDPSVAWSDPELDIVFIATRHHLHAEQTLAALKAGKHVWVEKPLCLNLEELAKIESSYSAPRTQHSALPILMVGFNRRFAPMTVALRKALQRQEEPVEIWITVNAGRLDANHWTLDREVGGGRIVGEGCHFIDLARFLVGSPIQSASCLRRDENGQDGGCFGLNFQNESKAVIDYRTDLPAHIPKEVIEVKGKGFSATVHNWKRLQSHGLGGLSKARLWSQKTGKGHKEAVSAFLKSIRDGSELIPMTEMVEVATTAITLQKTIYK